MHRNVKNRKVRCALTLQRRFRSALVHSDVLSVYFCDEHQKPNYFGLMMIPGKNLKSFEKLDITTIIQCEKPASKTKNYIDITRSRGRGVFEVLTLLPTGGGGEEGDFWPTLSVIQALFKNPLVYHLETL